MDSKIPLPTDNIYKFYALFGLLLLVSCILAVTYIHQSTNALLESSYLTVLEIEAKPTPTQAESNKKALLESRIKVAKDDKDFYNKALSVLITAALFCLYKGLTKWHREIQPKQDRLLDLQIQKAELELEQLKKAKEAPDETP